MPYGRPFVSYLAALFLRLSRIVILVEGADRLARDYPCVIVANHSSYWDVPIGLTLFRCLDISPAIVVGEWIEHLPLYKWVAKSLNLIVVARGTAGRRALLGSARRELEVGCGVAVMPQGHLGDLSTLRPGRLGLGAAMVAIDTARPIIPMGVAGVPRGWNPIRSRQEVRVVVGHPIRALPGTDEARITAEVSLALQELHRRATQWEGRP